MDLTDRLLIVVSASGSAAISEMGKLEKSAKGTDSAFGNMSKSLKSGLVAGATALVGTGLVAYLQDSVEAYGDAAKAAGELADATGGSVDEVSRMQAALMDAGISADESAGLLTKFTTNAGKNKDLLDELGVTVKTNADGSKDYADAMVQAVDQIGKMGDASQRNQAYVDLFGKKGATAFQELAASGVDLSDAMAAISKYRVFDTADVARAVAYDDAMDKLGGSAQGLKFALGEALIPALSGLVDMFGSVVESATPVVEFLAGVPAEFYGIVAAAVALNAAMKSELVAGVVSGIGTMVAQSVTGLAVLRTEMGITAALAQTTSKAITTAFLANPVAWVIAGIAGAFLAVTAANKNFNAQVEVGTKRLKELTDAGTPAAEAIDKVAREMEGDANVLENYWSALTATNDAWYSSIPILGSVIGLVDAQASAVRDGGMDQEHYAEALREAQEELGAYGAVQQMATQGQDDLNAVVAQFLDTSGAYTTVWADVAAAARDANAATLEQKQATELATIASGMYATSIQGVIEWQERLNGLTPTVEESLNKVQGAYQTLKETTDDPQTWGDEMEIQAGTAKDALLQLVADLAAQGWTTDQIKEYLMGVKLQEDASPQLQSDIDTVLAQIQGKGNEIPVDLTSGDVSGAQTAVDEMTQTRTAEVDIDVTNPKGAASVIDGVATARTVPMTIDIVNDRGAASVLDNVARNRTAYIDIVVRGQQSAARAISSLPQVNSAAAPTTAGVQPMATAAAPASITNNWTVSINGAVSPDATVRALRRYVRDNGNPDRTVVTT